MASDQEFQRYKPKRSAKRWLEGAPEYVVACYDNGGRTADRYTVLFGGSLWEPAYARLNQEAGNDPRLIQSVNMSESPTSPQGVSMWGDSLRGPHLGRKVRWLDLPPHIRTHVRMRVGDTEKAGATPLETVTALQKFGGYAVQQPDSDRWSLNSNGQDCTDSIRDLEAAGMLNIRKSDINLHRFAELKEST